MKKFTCILLAGVFILLSMISCAPQKEDPMTWWREARFGMFIHWGLYSIPAGEWNGKTTYAEWIRDNARIPLETYDQFVGQFNPVDFDAEAWVQMAKDAGMKYIVITTKHHDGFCLFDSKYTDFDVMSTPFKRDVMKEISDAAHASGIKICWYHSIMDWHHPDYLPRRGWETERSTEGADFERFVTYLKNQLEELVTNYGDIGVLWFDGEWESTWTPERGWEIYNYMKGMKPDLIVNNRVGKGRSGMQGFDKEGHFAGDFGTPEQEIPGTGLPGVDWETNMTMNGHWGWNKNDHDWKSPKDLLQKLADIASKGGNFLLNVGPRPDGTFPPEAVERLAAIGAWMKTNGESIYGTSASPFKYLDWGRCTQKPIPGGTRLYLHVFDWPDSGILQLPGLQSKVQKAYLLTDPASTLEVTCGDNAVTISLPEMAPDSMNSIVVLDIEGQPRVFMPPVIRAEEPIFIDSLQIVLATEGSDMEIRYTLDGGDVNKESTVYSKPLVITETTTVKARGFLNGKPVTAGCTETYKKVTPIKAVALDDAKPGIHYDYYSGDWELVPDFGALKPVKSGVLKTINISPATTEDYYAFLYTGYVKVPQTGVYRFYTDSDDGSLLTVDDTLIVNNDGIHGSIEISGVIALEAGYHPLSVGYNERTGGSELKVSVKGPGVEKQEMGPDLLFYAE